MLRHYRAQSKENVAEGSTVCTDEHKAYQGLDSIAEKRYVHKTVNHSAGKYVDGEFHTNSIASVWAILKRSFGGYFSLNVEEASATLRKGTGISAK